MRDYLKEGFIFALLYCPFILFLLVQVQNSTYDYSYAICSKLPFVCPGPELTLAVIKPDGMSHENQIMEIIVKNGFKVIQDKTLQLSEEEVAIWYADKHEAPYYRDLVNYLTRGPIRVIVLSRVYAISGLRNLIGPTKPQPNTIRGLYGTNVQENAIHASDSKAAARREINFFF